jgi:hypothetical protein
MSTTSKVGIFNAALSYVGSDVVITSALEASKAAQICNLHYDDAIKSRLESFDWGFARKSQLLATSADPAPSRWLFRYGIPSDCVMPRSIDDGVRVRNNADAIRWEIEGRSIVTDMTRATLLYTAQSDVPAYYPQHFADSVAWELAARIAMPITKNPKIAEYARSRSAFELANAQARDATAAQADPDPDTEFVTGRQ